MASEDRVFVIHPPAASLKNLVGDLRGLWSTNEEYCEILGRKATKSPKYPGSGESLTCNQKQGGDPLGFKTQFF